MNSLKIKGLGQNSNSKDILPQNSEMSSEKKLFSLGEDVNFEHFLFDNNFYSINKKENAIRDLKQNKVDIYCSHPINNSKKDIVVYVHGKGGSASEAEQWRIS